MEVSRITVDDVSDRLERGEPLTFLDTRSAESWNKADSQIAGSIRVPPDDVEAHLDEIPKGRALVAYCT